MYLKIFLCFYILFCTGVVFANEQAIDLFNPMEQTPSINLVDNITKPNNFGKSNNLTRKAGSFKRARGEPLYIKGKITDAFGIPISNAKIKIWQTNAYGKYQDLLEEHDKNFDKNFTMSGESISNNLGNYEFITVFPGFYDDRAPHINIIIYHKKFGIIETEFYFQNHPLNMLDPQYLAYSIKDRNNLTSKVFYLNDKNPKEGKIAIFNIVMDGVHDYKRY